MKKKRPSKRQFGGFNLPSSLTGLFAEGTPTFDQVMALAPQLDTAAGTDIFSRAFAEDNPDLITGAVMKQGAMAQATEANPLLTPEQISSQAEETAKKKSFLGIGKKRQKRLAEQGLLQQNQVAQQMNQLQGSVNQISNNQNLAGATELLGMLETWMGQRGGNPSQVQPQAVPPGQEKITWEEAEKLTADDAEFIKSLKDDKVGRGYVDGLLLDMGFEAGPDAVKKYKEIQGLNVSPKKGADNKIDAALLDWLSGHYKHFQYSQWGLDPRKLQELQTGGKAMLGYSDNSPYKYLPEIDIPGNNITMANTGMPLVGIPDVGQPRVMAPYSGEHNFPGASQVKEVPMTQMKKGGRKKTRTVPYYQVGGGGEQAQEEMQAPPVGVQLEEGELFATDQLDIIDVNARKKHKNMKKDDITDVLRGTDYVFSDDPTIKVTRKRAEDVSFGLPPVHYKEGEIGEVPKEITAADIIPDGEEEMILADYVKEIRKTYKMSDREDDVFSRKTNDANKASRVPHLAAAVLFNEEKRTKGKSPMTGFASKFENRFENAYTSGAGVDMDQNQHVAFGEIPYESAETSAGVPEGKTGGRMVPKGQFGLDGVGQIANLAGDILGIFTSAANGRTARRALAADRPQINQLAQTEGMYSDLSHGAQMAGLVAQDPTVNAPQYDPTQLNARPRNVSPSLFQLASARAMAGNKPYLDAVMENAGDFSEAVNAYSPVQAAAQGTLADLGMREVEKNLELETQYRDMKQGFDDRQTLADTTAANATRTNANQLTGALGQTAGSAIGSRGRIAANRINSLRQNSLQAAQAKIDANAATTAAIQNAGASAANTGFYFANANNSQPLNNNPDVSGSNAGTTVGGVTYSPEQMQALFQLMEAMKAGRIQLGR